MKYYFFTNFYQIKLFTSYDFSLSSFSESILVTSLRSISSQAPSLLVNTIPHLIYGVHLILLWLPAKYRILESFVGKYKFVHLMPLGSSLV